MRTVADLPAILRQAVTMGLFSSAQLVRFFAMDVRPNVTRTVTRNLPPSVSGWPMHELDGLGHMLFPSSLTGPLSTCYVHVFCALFCSQGSIRLIHFLLLGCAACAGLSAYCAAALSSLKVRLHSCICQTFFP